MPTHPLHTRKRRIVTDFDVPRMKNGGIGLCHKCQWRVYAAGGYIELLIDRLLRESARLKVVQMWLDRERRGNLKYLPRPDWAKWKGLEFKTLFVNDEGKWEKKK